MNNITIYYLSGVKVLWQGYIVKFALILDQLVAFVKYKVCFCSNIFIAETFKCKFSNHDCTLLILLYYLD